MSAPQPTTLAEIDAKWRAARERLWAGSTPSPRPKLERRRYAPQIVREISERQEPIQHIAVRHRDWLLVRPAKAIRGKAFGDVPTEVLLLLPMWTSIAREVCAEFGVTMAEIKSPRRDRKMVVPRQKLAWRLKKETPMTVAAIGKVINRDHTTVLHSIARWEQGLR